MATKCWECGGLIPDVVIGRRNNKNDCKNHIKPNIDVKYPLKNKDL